MLAELRLQDHRQQHRQGRGGECNHPLLGLRPDEPTALQGLGVKRHADAVVPEDLHQIGATAAEDVTIARMEIARQGLLHAAQGGQGYIASHTQLLAIARSILITAASDRDKGLGSRGHGEDGTFAAAGASRIVTGTNTSAVGSGSDTTDGDPRFKGLGHKPELLLHAPAKATITPGGDLHHTCHPITFSMALRTTL
jgi:hypothetical protein